MTEGTSAVLALLILAWAVTSDLLARLNITGPVVFAISGYALGNPDWGPLSVDVEAPSVHRIAELSLALLLFSDAARVNLSRLKADARLPGRLLAIGLPLSVILGSLFAAWFFSDFTWALAGFVGATLAPTDAALSAQVINDRRIPMRLRRALNVESGLNDGIVTPVVTFTLAVAAGELGTGSHDSGSDHGGGALLELAIGLIIGLAVGTASARLVMVASRRHWMTKGAGRLATLAAALGSFELAVTLSGNGFIAAFVAGIAFGAALSADAADAANAVELPERLGEVLALAVWFLFGAALVPIAVHNFDLALLAYAVLSLTVVRIVPVALALLGAGLDRSTVLFVGWFGPRGLASVVFALLAVEELGEAPVVEHAVAVIALTVLLSVVLHGVTAGPFGSRYVHGEQAGDDAGAAPRSRRSAHH